MLLDIYRAEFALSLVVSVYLAGIPIRMVLRVNLGFYTKGSHLPALTVGVTQSIVNGVEFRSRFSLFGIEIRMECPVGFGFENHGN